MRSVIYKLLLFNKLSLCPYMVRKPSISVILHDRYPAIYVYDHIWKCTADFLSLLVWERFENHFIVKRNVIFERAKFNSRNQRAGESVDSFITDLYGLARHCNFGALKEELIRDRIVVGLQNRELSEKLQLDPNLTLEKATNLAR